MSVKPLGLATFDPAGVASKKTTMGVQVLQGEGMHDTAIITLRNTNMADPELQPGTPISLQYGYTPGDVETFYGYVDHIRPHYDLYTPDISSCDDVICLGESYVFKDPFVGAWTSTQASTLVTQIVAKYKMAALIQVDDYPWSQLSSSGCSAWQFMVQLADKVGYTLSCNKDLLRFTSVAMAMNQNWANMPLFPSRNTQPVVSGQGITRFQSLQGEATTGTKAFRSIAGLSTDSNQMVAAYNNASVTSILGDQRNHPFFAQQVSDTVVSSQGEAFAALAGMAESNRFNIQGAATLTGLTSVTQGMPIVLTGLGTNDSGMWWVQEVCHNINSKGYYMDVSLGRDSTGDNGVRPVLPNAVAYNTQNPFAYAVHQAPKTVLVQQRWRSATAFNVFVKGS
jgi:hypothetical protein